MRAALLKNVYRISWAIVFGQLVFAISSFAAELLHETYQILPGDGYWSLYTWPLGIWAGCFFANRSLLWRRFHILCLIAGGILTPILAWQAVRYFQLSQALKGTGILAGFGESINAIICSYLGTGSLCVFIAGAVTTFDGWRFSLRTLLIAMTLIAVVLGIIAVSMQ